jgi:hypothetical protein
VEIGVSRIELIVGALVLALVVAAFASAAQDDKLHMNAHFEHREFQTSTGLVHGRDLRVVRYVHESIGSGDRFDGRTSGLKSGWWYCVAPGPRWYTVIGQEDAMSWSDGEIKWVLSELHAGEMRNALAGDAQALEAAFGPVGRKHDDA